MEEANGYKQRIIATAEGDASRFKQILVEYSKAPEVTRSRMYLETIQQVYANTSKVMVDTKGSGNLLYLPLDKLMQTVGAATPATTAMPEASASPLGAAAAPPAPSDVPPQLDRALSGDTRSRDAMRSRERGDR